MKRVVWMLVLLLSGCSDADRPPPPPPSDNETKIIPREQVANGDPRNEIATGPCAEGETFVCRFYSKAHGNVQSCFVGEQHCIGGTWGDCGDAVEVSTADQEDDDSSESNSESSGGY